MCECGKNNKIRFYNLKKLPFGTMIRKYGSVGVVLRNRRAFSSVPAVQEKKDEVKYPPIVDLSFEAKKYRKKEILAEKLQQLNTVEEKLMGLNMPKYWGFKCIMLNDKNFPYNSLQLIQYATRTLFHETKENLLPDFYKKDTETVDGAAAELKPIIEDAILFELEAFRQMYDLRNDKLTDKEKKDILSSSLVKQIHRAVVNSLGDKAPHLTEADTDVDPNHEAFWFVGGIEPLSIVQKIREGTELQKDHKMDPLDRPFQYIGNPHLSLRHRLPLEPIAPVLEGGPFEIPVFKLDPRTLGFMTAYRHGINAPGYRPGNAEEFGLLSYQRRTELIDRNPKYGAEDFQEALHSSGISGAFGWALGQACYQGFTTYNDLTYPLVSQSIITDGKLWSFYAYQLNTIVLHSHFAESGPKANECWGTKEMSLYENIDPETGKMTAFNDQVLKNLIHFYLNQPKERQGVNLKPYLKEDERYVSEIQDPAKRDWLQKHYHHLSLNKPRHNLVYEIYNWEKIYMVDHNTRPLAPKRRPFQLKINPYDKPLNAHKGRYIPKALRPDGPKSKKKRETTYYPDV